MAYCTKEQVGRRFKGGITFSTTTAVTAAAVDEYIEEADAEIDAKIGLRYQTPVTAAEAVKILRSISLGIVVGQVKEQLTVKSSEPKANQESRGGDPGDKARKKLEAIVEGKLLLPGATLKSSADGVRSHNVDEGIELTFKKNRVQW